MAEADYYLCGPRPFLRVLSAAFAAGVPPGASTTSSSARPTNCWRRSRRKGLLGGRPGVAGRAGFDAPRPEASLRSESNRLQQPLAPEAEMLAVADDHMVVQHDRRAGAAS